MTTDSPQQRPQQPAPQRDYIGYVKWFDNEKGYGFLRILTQGDRYEEDVFVHQSNICTKADDVYRALSTSECFLFNLSSDDRPQALEVTGVNGTLFCERYRPRRAGNRNNQRQSEPAPVAVQ